MSAPFIVIDRSREKTPFAAAIVESQARQFLAMDGGSEGHSGAHDSEVLPPISPWGNAAIMLDRATIG
jgi:hypothetical protein